MAWNLKGKKTYISKRKHQNYDHLEFFSSVAPVVVGSFETDSHFFESESDQNCWVLEL